MSNSFWSKSFVFVFVGIGLLSSNLGLARLADVAGDWRTATIPLLQGLRKERALFSLKPDLTCKLRFDEQIEIFESKAAYRHEYQCHYVLDGESKIDFTILKAEITPFDENAVNSANENKWCGVDGWQLGTTRDVTGLACSEPAPLADRQVIRDVYQVDSNSGFLYIGQNLARDETLGDPDVPRDESGRPLSVSTMVAFARNGQTPPPVNRPGQTPDVLTSLYTIESVTLNEMSCAAEGQRLIAPDSFAFIYPANAVFPLMPGWMGKTCKVREGCEVPEGMMATVPWYFDKVQGQSDRWQGPSTTGSPVGGVCRGTRVEHVAELRDDGVLVIQDFSKKFSTPIPPDHDPRFPCDFAHPAVAAAIEAAPCQSLRVTRLRK